MVPGSIPGPATYFRFSFPDSRRAVISYWREYVHEVLVNRFGGLSLSRKSVVKLADRPDGMSIAVYRGRKNNNHNIVENPLVLVEILNYDIAKVRKCTKNG